MKSRIDPNRELFKWGPIDGRTIYIDTFTYPFVLFPDYFEGSWPDIIYYIKEDRILFVVDYENLRKNGSEIFRKYILDEKELKKNYDIWSGYTKELDEYEIRINKGLSSLSDQELSNLFIEWFDVYTKFWIWGFLPELSNWGGEEILKMEIQKKNPLEFVEIFEKISAPEDLSFFQKEELELLKIRLKVGDEELKKHQQKYYWLRNSYAFTKVLDVDFFKKEMNKFTVQEAKEKINEIEDFPSKIKKEKEKVFQKYEISEDVKNISSKLAYCVWWQDYRKSFIFKCNHVITKFLEEISKRKEIDFKELCYYNIPEMLDLFKNNKRVNAKERYGGYIEYYTERGKMDYLSGEDVNKFIDPYISIKIDPKQKEIKGMVVSSGEKVTGNVKILTSPRNMGKMKEGDILIAPMTSPDFIIAMRRASAIITDEGGMTSHAAIVSRELGIPCLVGTRIATKVFKDNDVIEVDPKEGIVRKV
ncbi:PEP-utilizing enzyme [Nanoarchaeota archaeon]